MRIHVSFDDDFSQSIMSGIQSIIYYFVFSYQTGSKPFKCTHDQSGKSFSARANRNAHFRLHFGPIARPHKCKMCSEAFARPGLLSKHYLKTHGEEVHLTSTSTMLKTL